MRLEDARLDEIDLDGILNFAQYLLKDVGRLWFEASTDQKQRLQQVIFPKGVEGVEYLDGEFRTPEISLIFSIFHAPEGAKEGEASPTVPSWNQLVEWLRELDLLRRAEAA